MNRVVPPANHKEIESFSFPGPGNLRFILSYFLRQGKILHFLQLPLQSYSERIDEEFMHILAHNLLKLFNRNHVPFVTHKHSLKSTLGSYS